ncbi:MAG TPA: recombinase family protein [Isosphaeraceae bacterium]|nr:recombinase family protein [Isosphaeraceae bacterium]
MGQHVAVSAGVSGRAQDADSREPNPRRRAEGQDRPIARYRDQFTGTSMDRPGWNGLTKAVLEGKVSAVVGWRLDRLGRTAQGLTALFDDLVGRKINLVSWRDGLDRATPAGRLMANVLASVAQYETEVRAERIVAGQAAARARGSGSADPRGPAGRSRSRPSKRRRSAGSRPRARRSPRSPAPSG